MVDSGDDRPTPPENEHGLSRRELLIRVGVYGPPIILAGGALVRSGVAFGSVSEDSGGGDGDGGGGERRRRRRRRKRRRRRRDGEESGGGDGGGGEESGGGGGGGGEEGGGGGGGEEGGGGGGFAFTGFFSPVDNPPVSNGVNAGRAIPVSSASGATTG